MRASRRCRPISRCSPPRSRTGGWSSASSGKIKKQPGAAPPALTLVPNPDILATIAAAGPNRPRLVVGFAAETDDLMANAQGKLRAQECRLDRGERCLAGDRHHGRRGKRRAPRRPPPGSRPGRAWRRTMSPAGWRSRIADLVRRGTCAGLGRRLPEEVGSGVRVWLVRQRPGSRRCRPCRPVPASRHGGRRNCGPVPGLRPHAACHRNPSRCR